MRSLLRVSQIAVVVGVALLAGLAAAQPCADPDGDGDVTDADGMITLQAAAGLDTDCSLTICDINSDGVIDDTDGVLVFRKAAGLEVEEDCLATGSGPVDQRVVILVERVLPFLRVPFQFVPQLGGLPTPDPNDPTTISCDNGFDDGEVFIEADDVETLITFSDCLFGNTNFDGDISDGSGGFLVSLVVLDVFSDDDITYDAEGLLASDTGTALRVSGTLIASPFFSFAILEDADEFELNLSALEITPMGALRSGRATLDLVDANLPGLREIEMVFDGTNIAVVTITDDSFAEDVRLYDLATERFL